MQVTHSDNAVWDVTLALRAVQLGLGYRVGTVGARFQWFLNLTLVWFPMHACGRVAKQEAKTQNSPFILCIIITTLKVHFVLLVNRVLRQQKHYRKF